MDRRWRHVAAVLLAGALSACTQKPVEQTVAEVVTPVVVAARAEVQAVVVPHVELRPDEFPAGTVESLPPLPAPDRRLELASGLIVKWEVSSEATYNRKYQGIVCPPGSSGPTLGIGYDLGPHTGAEIAGTWRDHPQVEDLTKAAGQMGAACRPAKARLAHVRTPWTLALSVFEHESLPAYCDTTRRAYGPAYDDSGQGVWGALCSNTYNRGGSMLGSRNAEKREIRDTCLPAHDAACTARALRKQCRLWPDTPGLCYRREDEATTAEKDT